MTIEQLAQKVEEAKRIAFFGGAGVSTESGVPDFRSKDGLYNTLWDYPPETVLSHDFFFARPKEFYRFYFEKIALGSLLRSTDGKEILPNGAHKAIAEWEKRGKLSAVITQNIDGLHQKAGSRKVYELHGSVHRNFCTKCKKFFSLADMLERAPLPRCDCGGLIKPNVVLYGEPLDDSVVEGAIQAIATADLLIVGGTSLTVYPAAGFISFFRGATAVAINRDPLPNFANQINASIADTLSKL